MPTKSAPARRPHAKKLTNNYLTKLQSPKWQKVRLKVFERADWECETCSNKSNSLTVHHGYYRYGVEPWDLPWDTLWCLCAECHSMYQEELSLLKIAIGKLYPQDYANALRVIQSDFHLGHGGSSNHILPKKA